MIFPRNADWLSLLRTRGARLIKPAPSIIDLQERRNARLLSALLALTTVILLVGRIFRLVIPFYEPPFQVIAIWTNIVVLAAAYVVSRTRYYRIGAVLAVVMVSVIVYVQTMYRGYTIGGDLSNPAAWLVALLLLSSFVISWRATLALSVANLVGLWMLPRIVPGIDILDIRFSFELVLALSLVIALTAYLRRRDWSVIQAQTEALTDSENRYRTLFSASFEGIVVHDDGVVVEVNDTLHNMFGYSHEEMIGMHVLTFIPPELQTIIFEKARENILTYDIQGLRKDGTVFDMEVSVRRIMYKGKLLRVVAMRDITERKRVENERIQFITETERSRDLRQFISDA
jgi:PAS domain S-box-containing protein